ncbi:hypothetical protein RGU11_06910 [Rossellomorea marisflavi]|nr:hypothetical protein [Rossellomorea marisflavi]MDR4936096.1 hypothetical protein [Rossellomorea marisflavi]
MRFFLETPSEEVIHPYSRGETLHADSRVRSIHAEKKQIASPINEW